MREEGEAVDIWGPIPEVDTECVDYAGGTSYISSVGALYIDLILTGH